jgi:tellurite resistance protein TerC
MYYRRAKRIAVFVAGATLLLVGLALLVLPGPGLLILFLGLTVLASEFVWARLWLRRMRAGSERAGRSMRGWWRRRNGSADGE